MTATYSDHLFNTDYLASGSIATFDFNSNTGSGLAVAFQFRPLPGKTITDIGAYATSSTASSPILDFRLETVSANVPSGTLVAANTNKTGTPTASTFSYYTLTSSYAVATGDVLAAVIRYSSGLIDSTHHAVFNYRFGSGQFQSPMSMTFNGTSWSMFANSFPMMVVRYSDNTIQPLCLGMTTSATATTFNDGNNPDEYANAFVCPGNITVYGIDVQTRLFSGATGVVRIIDNSGTILTNDSECTFTAGVDGDLVASGRNSIIRVGITPLSLTDGSTYYLSLHATNATNNIQVNLFNFADLDCIKAAYGTSLGTYTRNNGGAWSGPTTTQIANIGLVRSAITGGGGGGYIWELATNP